MIAHRLAVEFDHLDPNVRHSFAQNGVVCLRGSSDPQVVAELRERPEVATQHPDPRYQYELSRHYSTVAFRNDPCNGDVFERPEYPVLWPR